MTAPMDQLGIRRVILRCLPSADTSFAKAAESALRNLSQGVEQPTDLELAIAQEYPHVDVVPQDPFARIGVEEIWYVHRDGQHRHVTEWAD